MQVCLVLLSLFRGFFWWFCKFWELQPSFQAWLHISADLCEFLAISSSRDEEMSSGTEEMEAERMQETMQGSAGFSLWHSENFARIAKTSQP